MTTEKLNLWTASELVHVVLETAELVKADLAEHAETGDVYEPAEAVKPVHELVADYLLDPGLLESMSETCGYSVNQRRRTGLEEFATLLSELG